MNFKKITLKPDQRLFFVSDIHGEIKHLLDSLYSLGFVIGKDLCVCAGDLVDRGSESLETLLFFLQDKTGSFISTIGNHDKFLIDQDYECQLYNGGQWILDLQYEERGILGRNVESSMFYALEIQTETASIGVVHAEIPEEFETWDYFVSQLGNKTLRQEIVWNRNFVEYSESKFYNKKYVQGIDYVIHGHTPVKEPLWVANRLHIDTGLVYGKHLTIAEFVNNTFKFDSFKLGE